MSDKQKGQVYIAGLGLISSIGNDVESCIRSLRQEKDGIAPLTSLDSIYKNQLPVAAVNLSNEQLSSITGQPASTSRTAMLAIVAAREAWKDAGIRERNALKTGLISSNSVGGMDKTENFYKSFLQNEKKGRLREVVNHECGTVTEMVADDLGIHDYVSTISTACSSGANSIFFAARLIKHGFLDVAIAGGVDALTRFTLNGFNTLQILDRDKCTPMDEH
ncbi:MAG: beta-ketoacyl-[acyl-carrier-protein] synthase family protein, partial [Gemmatimonadaceae bacterium]|nr:beta-ketoacyl-[acyl-carrier-protein] synthase family protein [Chitinophagaceae bacterium]